MIVNHRHQFIFIKTAKTASTSVELALSAFCGPRDIVTPIDPVDESVREAAGHQGPANYLAPLMSTQRRDWAHLVKKRARRMRFYNHISAKEVKQYLSPRIWTQYHKFTTERNPWDKAVSFYYWRHRESPRPHFSDFLRSRALDILKMRGYGLYTIGGELAVDSVCLHDSLEADLSRTLAQCGIHGEVTLPTAKGQYRTNKEDYRTLYNERDRQLVARVFKEEIALFGFEF